MKVLFNGSAKRIFLVKSKGIEELNFGNYITKISKIKEPKELKFSAVHIFGGVKSGENQDCIVNSFGKSFKYENLYINDSSLINENLLKNPQGTVMFIAKRNIEKFINENK
jgi:choline dehydrogenase-like flavoprotein